MHCYGNTKLRAAPSRLLHDDGVEPDRIHERLRGQRLLGACTMREVNLYDGNYNPTQSQLDVAHTSQTRLSCRARGFCM